MTKSVKYIGTTSRWPELAVTGKQSTWEPGKIEERSDTEAAQLLGTGLFADQSALQLPDSKVAAISAVVSGERNRTYPLENHGDIEEAMTFATAAMTSGSPVLAVTGYTFGASDVGKTVGVLGAGVVSANFEVLANDGVLVGTILSVSGGNATLSVNATNTVSGASCVFGWPIDTALTAAIAACRADYAVDGVVGYIDFPAGKWLAIVPQPISSGVSFQGAGRDSSFIYIVKIVSAANNPVTAPWLQRLQSPAVAGLYDNINLRDFTLIGTFYAATSAYGSDMKMLHISNTSNSTVQRIRTVDNPSTAIGYDESTNCLIADNIILNPGRLAASTVATGGPGGSGIGVAIGEYRDTSMVIRNNFIKGKFTSSGGPGRSGINIEASTATLAPGTMYGGLVIVDNFIEGFYNGIVDSGAIGTIIRGNTVRNCTHAIKAGSNGITTGHVGRDTIISGNYISDLFAVGAFYSVGISVTTQNATKDTEGRCLVEGNVITSCIGGYGIQIYGEIGGTTYVLDQALVANNTIRDCSLSGIRVLGNVKGLVIEGNHISSNGRALTAGNRAPILLHSSVVWTDGRLVGNLYTDYQGSPTQDVNHSFDAAATVTNVIIDPVVQVATPVFADLPTAGLTRYKGARAYITNCNTTTFNAAAAGGGANVVPVICNGTAWVVG